MKDASIGQKVKFYNTSGPVGTVVEVYETGWVLVRWGFTKDSLHFPTELQEVQ